jgi:hypothetical protein
MNTRDVHDDCRYWQLTPQQCAHHHIRLAIHWAQISSREARLAAHYSRRAATCWAASALCFLLAAVSVAAWAVWS